MEFNSINLVNGIILAIIMMPNIVYAYKQHDPVTQKDQNRYCKIAEFCEQIGRYGCMFFLIFPVAVWEFSLTSSVEKITYYIACVILLAFYLLFWISYFKKKNLVSGIALALLPAILFLFMGIMLNHWCLVASAVFFGIFHIWITVQTHVSRETN